MPKPQSQVMVLWHFKLQGQQVGPSPLVLQKLKLLLLVAGAEAVAAGDQLVQMERKVHLAAL